MVSQSIDPILDELREDPRRPVLVIDERRFGPTEGFESEVVLFAGVRTTVEEALRFAAALQVVRQTMDEQKRQRALKSADVLRGRLSNQLVESCARLLSWASVEFWASTTSHLVTVKRERPGPASVVVAGTEAGRRINGHETPVLEMISGHVADELRATQLEVFVDRSSQNGLHERAESDFVIWDQLSTATALHDGQTVKLGAGCQIRHWAVSERTPLFGDVVLLGDLCAHLWGTNPRAVARLRTPAISHGVERIGTCAGLIVTADLRRVVAAQAADGS